MQARPVLLGRAQIGKAPGIDTTVKSAVGIWRAFAPTWEMVLGSKRGQLPWEEYEEQYLAILERVPVEVWRALWRHGLENGGEAVVTCYCRDGKPCHTLSLALRL